MNTKPIIKLVREQSELTPDSVAVVYRDERYTYRDVLTHANGIAQQIAQAGLVREEVVGILIPRSQWLAIVPQGNDEALSRIKTLYFYYFGHTEAFSHFDKRVTAFAAEVTEANACDSLNKAFTVVNCVANVKHWRI